MPSYEHEIALAIVRDHPQSIPSLVQSIALEIEIPEFTTVKAGSEALTDTNPVELNCDGVEICYDENDRPVCAFITEIQLKRDDRKPAAWLGYLSNLYRRAKCPVYLIAICPDKSTADWARRPVFIGHQEFRFRPYVVGPDEVPIVSTRLNGTAGLVTTYLSAMIHGEGAPGEEISIILNQELGELDSVQAAEYAKGALRTFRGVARMTLGALMQTREYDYHELVLGDSAEQIRTEVMAEGMAQGMAQGKAEGKAEGESTALIRVVEARGMTLTEDQRAQVNECQDLDLLGQWITRAVTATKTDDIFDG